MSELAELRDNFALDASMADLVENVLKDSNEVFAQIQEAQKMVTMNSLIHEEANNTEKLAEMDTEYRKVIDLENKLRNQELTIKTLKARLLQGERIKDVLVPYEAIQMELLQKINTEEKKYLTNDKYISYRQAIWNVNHPDELMPNLVENEDDDIVMGSTKISLKCPITTTWLENPVTSNQCKHTYSKAAIMDLLRQNGNYTVCPIPGCNRGIRPDQLVADEVMADRVTRARAREEQRANDTQYFEVE